MGQIAFTELRRLMLKVIAAHAQVSSEMTGRAVLDPRVVEVMGEVPRHEFVPAEYQAYAYEDGPLPIGHDKTISQPFIVALMVDLLDLDDNDTVLEVGTGLGYQAAVLSRLVSKVYTMDIMQDLATDAVDRLKDPAGYDNVEVRIGNGYYGWLDYAPFDKIIVAAAPEHIPSPLVEQLKPGGRMVLPLGTFDDQQLVVVEKDRAGDVEIHQVLPVRFAQMVIAH